MARSIIIRRAIFFYLCIKITSNMMRLAFILSLILAVQTAYSQLGLGISSSYDLYNVYSNPVADQPVGSEISRKNGSALSSFGVGPKLWVGGESFSVSAEALANLSPLGLSLGDYKGLGAVSFPIMGHLNFGGMSSFNKLMKAGFSIGGGIQYNRTELFGLTDSFEGQGVTRDFFKTYNIQVGVGGGLNGFTGKFYTRYGFNPDIDGAWNLNIGLQMSLNFLMTKNIHRPESAL